MSFSLRRIFFWVFLIFALFFQYFYFIQWRPGFHFDEAWAANYAYRIAFEPGFWPIAGMSAYTTACTHYVAALFFKIFGVNVTVFRVSQMTLTFLGLLFAFLAARKRFQIKGFVFLSSLLMIPALVFNHRFAIEMNSFHVFCFGLLFFSFIYERYILLIIAIFLGISSHVLFIAPVVGIALAAHFHDASFLRSKRLVLSVLALLLFVFFARIAWLLPKPTKGIALIVLDLFFLIYLWASQFFDLKIFKVEAFKKLEKVLRFISVPFVVTVLFFSFGFWSILGQMGHIAVPFFASLNAAFFVLILWHLWKERKNIPSNYLNAFLFSALIAGLIMLKAAPRYYEFSFLLLALFFALIWERVKYVKLFFVFFVITQCAGLYLNYFSSPVFERESRFLFWKDSSRDFLAKQELTRFFGLNDCHISDIASGDARVVDTFKFLQHGDWLITNSDAKCKWGKVRVEREEFRLNNNEFLKKYEFLLWQENK